MSQLNSPPFSVSTCLVELRISAHTIDRAGLLRAHTCFSTLASSAVRMALTRSYPQSVGKRPISGSLIVRQIVSRYCQMLCMRKECVNRHAWARQSPPFPMHTNTRSFLDCMCITESWEVCGKCCRKPCSGETPINRSPTKLVTNASYG